MSDENAGPARWPVNDKIIAVAALVLAVSVFVPWFRASVTIRGAAGSGYGGGGGNIAQANVQAAGFGRERIRNRCVTRHTW